MFVIYPPTLCGWIDYIYNGHSGQLTDNNILDLFWYYYRLRERITTAFGRAACTGRYKFMQQSADLARTVFGTHPKLVPKAVLKHFLLSDCWQQ